jgi:hypothetical protein
MFYKEVHPRGVEPRVAVYKTDPQYRRGRGANFGINYGRGFAPHMFSFSSREQRTWLFADFPYFHTSTYSVTIA